MNRTSIAGITGLLALLLATAPAAAPDPAVRAWLPAKVESQLVRQLLGRLQAATGRAPADPAQASDGARGAVHRLAVLLEQHGEAWLAARAPRWDGLELPSTGSPPLDGMLSLQVCAMPLALQFEPPADAAPADARQVAALGLAGIAVAQLYLRGRFLAAGGDVAAIQPALSGAHLQPVLEAIQSGGAVSERIAGDCAPILEALLEPMVEPGASPAD